MRLQHSLQQRIAAIPEPDWAAIPYWHEGGADVAEIPLTLRRRLLSLPGRIRRSARRLLLRLPRQWPWAAQWSAALTRLRAIPLPLRA